MPLSLYLFLALASSMPTLKLMTLFNAVALMRVLYKSNELPLIRRATLAEICKPLSEVLALRLKSLIWLPEKVMAEVVSKALIPSLLLNVPSACRGCMAVRVGTKAVRTGEYTASAVNLKLYGW